MSEKRNRRSLGEMQLDAQEYAAHAFTATPFAIPDGHMDKQAPIILRALGEAWAAGYAARAEEKSR